VQIEGMRPYKHFTILNIKRFTSAYVVCVWYVFYFPG